MSVDRRLWTACTDLLAVAVNALDGETVGGELLLPDVRLVQQGPGWSWDPCERLVVHPESVQAVQQAASAAGQSLQLPSVGCAVMPVAGLVVTLLFCVPKAGDNGRAIPAVDDVEAASERLHVAGMTLWRAVARARADGTWGDCDGVTVGDAAPTGAQGGYAGWRVPVTVELAGLAAAGS